MPKIVDVEQRRSEIAAAAARLIERGGLEAVTMRDVATECGWTTGVVTHYFADKAELLLSTFHASLAERRSSRPATDTENPLTAALEGALPLDADQRRHWTVTVAFCSHATGNADLAAAQQAAYRGFRDRIEGLCGERSLAEQLVAAADGIALQALFDPASWPPEHQRTQLRTLVDAIVNGP